MAEYRKIVNDCRRPLPVAWRSAAVLLLEEGELAGQRIQLLRPAEQRDGHIVEHLRVGLGRPADLVLGASGSAQRL